MLRIANRFPGYFSQMTLLPGSYLLYAAQLGSKESQFGRRSHA
jgi:hypothetical protein